MKPPRPTYMETKPDGTRHLRMVETMPPVQIAIILKLVEMELRDIPDIQYGNVTVRVNLAAGGVPNVNVSFERTKLGKEVMDRVATELIAAK